MNKYGYLAFVASSGNIAVGYLKEGHALSLGSLPHGTPVSFASLAPFIERFLQEAFPLPATE
jgi:hypothetical protein